MFLSFLGFDDIFRFSKKSCFWYRCYYPHRSRESLSPVCGIFNFCFLASTYFILCIVGELAGGRSVAVAVGLGNMNDNP